jgi:DNA polymerase epsilon subunit 1
MQKIFALLLAELKKLGANVVFADFSHIIVETGKHQLAAAQGYCDYLVKILKSR